VVINVRQAEQLLDAVAAQKVEGRLGGWPGTQALVVATLAWLAC
jgi:hypothetical protein